MTPEADLAAWLDEHDGPAPNLDEAPTPIEDVEQAERRMNKLRRLARQKAEIQDVAASEVARILGWKDDRVSAIERAEAWIASSLEAWHRARVASKLIEGKSYKLASGTVKLRASGQTKLVVDGDESELATELRQTRPEWVREKLTLDKAEIKARTKNVDGQVVDAATGEVVPGLRYEKADEDTFSVEVAK